MVETAVVFKAFVVVEPAVMVKHTVMVVREGGLSLLSSSIIL